MPPDSARPAGGGGPSGDADVADTTSIPPAAGESTVGVTLGAGVGDPQGRWHGLPVWTAVSLAEVIGRHKGHEAWFSLSRFAAGNVTIRKTGEVIAVGANYRNGDVFEYAVGVGADIDTPDHEPLSMAARSR